MSKFATTIMYVLIFVVMALVLLSLLPGCQAHAVSETIIPATAWESTMKAVAKTNWFGTFCLLGFFGGIVAIGLDQRKIGGAVVIAAIATICLGLAIHRFPTWLAIIGFTSSIIAVAYSILIKNRALVEIIKGVQNYRNAPLHKADAAILDTELDPVQSKSTKKIVKQIKEKINGSS